MSARRLLHRYNCAQVQGLLLHCHTLSLKIFDSMTPQLRQLFKYLRFHQLLATIRKEPDGNYSIAVDGPLNLFYQTKRYGLNLATFFHAVLHQQKWELTAQIEFKNRRSYQLSLDDSCGILPYWRHFSAYIPEEIELFQELFHQKVEDWNIAPGSNFVPIEGELYCFPDYTLVHACGLEAAIELFHPWHASHLTARLGGLEGRDDPKLILGVSNVLLKDPLVAQSLEESAYFSRFGFVFRQIPTMSTVRPVLEKILEWKAEQDQKESC